MRYSFALLALAAPTFAYAAPCPTVMILLDRSGSMDAAPDGSSSSPSKLDIAKSAIQTLMMSYGDRIPFGYATFQENDIDCGQGIDILVEPMHGSSTAIDQQVAATMSGGGTNTGQAVDKVASDPNMHDPMRPASYIMLITDGEPNCPGTTPSTDPEYTVARIMAAASASMPIKTFVIGFGALPSADSMAMDQMAAAGGEVCMDASCSHKYYTADSATALNDAINAISTTIVGEFGGQCDDSCYANGCPNAGEICVMGKCKANPCATSICSPGDYCYTDGSSPGTCVHACTQTCPTGQTCSLQGTCVPDPCANVPCTVSGQTCKQGQCVTNTCATAPCSPGLMCLGGQCVDNPCSWIKCPSGATCVTDTGACAAGGAMPGGPGGRRAGGCEMGAAGVTAGPALLAIFLLGLVGLLRTARRARG